MQENNIYLFVGLGNIGAQLDKTHHNLGFMCVDKIIDKFNFSNHEVKFKADLYTGTIDGKKVIIAKPRTYMNSSGIAAAQIKNFYKIHIENIFVFHDDLDLEFCRVKIKLGGSSGGHNGIKSIDENIGKNYNRIRLGIGRPEHKDDVINFVLKKFNSDELKQIDILTDKIADNVTELFKDNKDNFINKIHTEQ